MFSQTEFHVALTIISFIITIITTAIAVFLIHHFITYRYDSEKKPVSAIIHASPDGKHSNKQIILENQNELQKHQDNVKISKYFKITASITLIFNSLNGFFNTIYCLYLIIDPVHDDSMYYIQHPSHIQRIISTISWYIAKISLIWFFSGRLYYAFKRSVYSVNRKLMKYINIFNTLFAFLSIIMAYWSTYNGKEHLLLAELSFNLWRIQYVIVMFMILYMFSKRLLSLTVQQQSVRHVVTPTHTKETTKNKQIHSIHSQSDNQGSFLMIITRNAVLVLTTSITVSMVVFCWFGFRFLFGTQTRLTLLIPMNMAVIDSFITSICVLCLFEFGDNVYYSLCKICHNQCYKLFVKLSVRILLHPSSTNLNLSPVQSMSMISPNSPTDGPTPTDTDTHKIRKVTLETIIEMGTIDKSHSKSNSKSKSKPKYKHENHAFSEILMDGFRLERSRSVPCIKRPIKIEPKHHPQDDITRFCKPANTTKTANTHLFDDIL